LASVNDSTPQTVIDNGRTTAAGHCIEASTEDLQDRASQAARRMKHISPVTYDFTVSQHIANWTRFNIQTESLLCREINRD
jgi:hypothetical protein